MVMDSKTITKQSLKKQFGPLGLTDYVTLNVLECLKTEELLKLRLTCKKLANLGSIASFLRIKKEYMTLLRQWKMLPKIVTDKIINREYKQISDLKAITQYIIKQFSKIEQKTPANVKKHPLFKQIKSIMTTFANKKKILNYNHHQYRPLSQHKPQKAS